MRTAASTAAIGLPGRSARLAGGSARLARRAWLAALLLGGWLLAAAPAAAQSCWLGGVGNFAFGTVNIHGNTDTSLGIGYTCQSNATTTYFRTCVYVADGSPIAGVNPRWMTNYNASQLAYNLYADAARTQVIGPPPSGGGYGGLTSTFTVPGGYVQASPSVTVHGRVPGNQGLPGGWTFQTQLGGSALYWAWSNTGYPPSCTAGSGGAGSATFYTQATATVPTDCRISRVDDLDFGAVAAVASNVDATSQITVRCPQGTSWNLSLGNGSHASGTVRRMRNASGNFVRYELYRNPGRTQRWGTALGTDTVSGSGAGDNNPQSVILYGRVPVQGALAGGAYADTVTITLTY